MILSLWIHMMPEMDGVDATIEIRHLEGEYYQNLPIIALTANALVGTREMFIREGMNDFLPNPIEMDKLISLLIKWLPQSKIIRVNLQKTVKTKEEESKLNIAGIDTEKGITSVGGKKETYLQILTIYYHDGKQKCSSLQQHVMQNNITAFRAEIHALKSTSATIGAFQISFMASYLEIAAQKNNISFIYNNINKFLREFQSILEGISSIVPISSEQELLDRNKIAGNTAYLKTAINSLNDALELANISLIEKNLTRLLKFTWPQSISTELLNMQQYINIFDYDSALECTIRLKALL